MVPSEVLVPRANGTFVSPDGGVAPLGATVIAVTTPASPTLTSAHLTDRFITCPFRTVDPVSSFLAVQERLSWRSAGGRGPPLLPPSRQPCARCQSVLLAAPNSNSLRAHE